jgi:hypothetical protein
MMRRYLVCLGLAAMTAVPLVARAQSLADVARAEEARRKAVKQPAKVYTNDDLKPSNEPPRPAASTSSVGAAATVEPPPAAPAAEDPKKTEKYWHERIALARTTLDHDKVLVDAVQSRINALTTDFVNTADPAQRAVIQTNRDTALAELDRLNKDIQAQTKAVSDIQEEARKASIPAGWLR